MSLESGTDSSFIVYIVPNSSPKSTVRTELLFVPSILIQHSAILFFAMTFAISAHSFEDSTSTLDRNRINCGYHRIDRAFFNAFQLEVTSNK